MINLKENPTGLPGNSGFQVLGLGDLFPQTLPGDWRVRDIMGVFGIEIRQP